MSSSAAAVRSTGTGEKSTGRRHALALITTCAVSGIARHAASADRPARIGYIGTSRNTPLGKGVYGAFVDEMHKSGFDVGTNLSIDFCAIEQSIEVLASQALAMVQSGAQLIVTDGTEAALLAASKATATLPIVMVATNFDPVAHGYAQTLAKPGRNVTGVFLRQTELAEKQTELLRQAVPEAKRIAMLWDAVSTDQFSAARRRAEALSIQVRAVKLERPPYDFEAAFRAVNDASPQALLVLSSPNFTAARELIARLAIQLRLPSMFIFKTYVYAGGLMSYGVDYEVVHRQVARYAVKILGGERPSELPIEQPDKFEMVLNLKTARSIGFNVPSSLLVRADEVIQ